MSHAPVLWEKRVAVAIVLRIFTELLLLVT